MQQCARSLVKIGEHPQNITLLAAPLTNETDDSEIEYKFKKVENIIDAFNQIDNFFFVTTEDNVEFYKPYFLEKDHILLMEALCDTKEVIRQSGR